MGLRAGLICIVIGQGIGCLAPADRPQTRPTVRFMHGGAGTFSEQLTLAYARSPTLQVEYRVHRGEIEALEAIQRGEADFTVTIAAIPYEMYRKTRRASPQAPRRLNAVAALQLHPLHIVVSGKTPIHSLTDLRGRTVHIGAQSYVRQLLDAAGVHVNEVGPFPVDDVIAMLRTGALDAAMTITYAPYHIASELTRQGGRVIPIEPAVIRRLVEQNPLMQIATIPAGTYPSQTRDVDTVGIYGLVVTRSDLDEAVVRDVTAELFKHLPGLVHMFPWLSDVDANWSSATPIPLHPGAARYYREWELRR